MVEPILPPIAVGAVAPAGTNVAGQTAGQTANGVTLPTSVAITGFVINRDGDNNPIIRTPLGDVTVPSNLFLKTGSEVTFSATPNNGIQILSVDHLSTADYAALTSRAPTSDSIVPPELEPQIAQPNAPATTSTTPATFTYPVLAGVVLQNNPAAANAPLPPIFAQLQTGTPLTLTVLDVELPPIPVAVSTIAEPANLAHLLPAAIAQAPAPAGNVTPPTTSAASAAVNPGNAALAQPAFAGAVAPVLVQAVAPSGTPPAFANAEGQETLPPELAAQATANVPTPPNPAPPQQTALPGAPPLPNAVPSGTLPTPLLANTAPGPLAAPTPTNAAPLPNPTAANPALPTAILATTVPLPTPLTGPAPSLPQSPAPAIAAAAGPTVAQGPVLTATVIGHGEDGLNILQAGSMTFKLYTTQPLPTDTKLQVAVAVAAHVVPSQLTALTELGARLAPAPDRFSYLDQALATLASQDPASARDLQQSLPVIGPRFTSGLLFFLTAVKNGTVDELLNTRTGKALDALAPGVLSKFTKDMNELNQGFTNSPLADWKSVPLPLIFGHEMHPARLYVRDEQRESGIAIESGKTGQRFVLDVDFSELGPMQFDGFVRQTDNRTAFELYLRAAGPLDTGFTQQIRQLFETTTQTAGLAGSIIFQTGSEHFIRPQPKSLSTEGPEGDRTILA